MAFDVDDLTMCLASVGPDPLRCDEMLFREAVDASASCGFRGLSVWNLHLEQLAEAGMSTRQVSRVCADAGLQVRMIEALTAWVRGGRDEIDVEARPLLARAAELGAEEVLACSLDTAPVHMQAAVEGFAYTCDLAARHGLGVGLEFLPWSAIGDLRTAWSLVHSADRANAGLVVDSWHWQRQPGGPDPTTLGAIPPERIHVLQLNDAPLEAASSLVDETMRHRLLPGDGEIDLVGLIGAIDVIGAEPMVAPEVFNEDLRALTPAEAAERIGAATRQVLLASAR